MRTGERPEGRGLCKGRGKDWPQGEGGQGLPEARRGKDEPFPPEALARAPSLNTLALDLRPPELWENTRLLF